jgi:hypothetical protein
MANVRVLWNRGGGYTGEIKKLAQVHPDTMEAAGNWLAVQLENRALSGRDEAGNRFKRYTDAYAKWKNVSPSDVDLHLSGDMWRSFGVLWASTNRVRLGFRSKAMERRARYNEEMGRRFLGLDPRWMRELRARLASGLGFLKK